MLDEVVVRLVVEVERVLRGQKEGRDVVGGEEGEGEGGVGVGVVVGVRGIEVGDRDGDAGEDAVEVVGVVVGLLLPLAFAGVLVGGECEVGVVVGAGVFDFAEDEGHCLS